MAVFTLTNPTASIHDLVVPGLASNTTWSDMVDVFDMVMFNNVEDPIRQLEDIRVISPLSDPESLKLTARLLGFDVSQDVLNMNSENLTKIVSQLAHYPDENGTENFYKFIDLILNAHTEVINLYTNNYVNFVKALNGVLPGVLLMDGGRWFKTTHIELRINVPNSSTLAVGIGQTVMDRIVSLFYSFSPAALVIELLTMVVVFGNQDWCNSILIHYNDSGPASTNPNIYTLMPGQPGYNPRLYGAVLPGSITDGAFGFTASLIIGDTHITLE